MSPRCPHPDTRDDLVPDAFRRSPKLATGSSSPRKIGAECPKPISGQLYDQNLLPPPKFFFAETRSTEGYPFQGRKPFLDRFREAVERELKRREGVGARKATTSPK